MGEYAEQPCGRNVMLEPSVVRLDRRQGGRRKRGMKPAMPVWPLFERRMLVSGSKWEESEEGNTPVHSNLKINSPTMPQTPSAPMARSAVSTNPSTNSTITPSSVSLRNFQTSSLPATSQSTRHRVVHGKDWGEEPAPLDVGIGVVEDGCHCSWTIWGEANTTANVGAGGGCSMGFIKGGRVFEEVAVDALGAGLSRWCDVRGWWC